MNSRGEGLTLDYCGDFDGHDPIVSPIQFLGQILLNRQVGYL